MYRVVSMLAVEYDRATLTTLATESLAKAAVSPFGGPAAARGDARITGSLSVIVMVGACWSLCQPLSH